MTETKANYSFNLTKILSEAAAIDQGMARELSSQSYLKRNRGRPRSILSRIPVRRRGWKLALSISLEQSAKALMATQEQDVRELPAYGVAEAAHYLLVPRATLRSWLAGMSYGTGSERKLFKPVIHPAAKSPLSLSFINLIEAVLAAIRRKHRVDASA